jgi:hypothetical protein
MSTRDSVWIGENGGRSVHLYFELAERELDAGQIVAAPLYLAVSGVDATGDVKEVAVRLPKEFGEALLSVLSSSDQRHIRCKVL